VAAVEQMLLRFTSGPTCDIDDAHCVLRHGLQLGSAAGDGLHRLRRSVQLMRGTCRAGGVRPSA
jgi:hypothetical protein